MTTTLRPHTPAGTRYGPKGTFILPGFGLANKGAFEPGLLNPQYVCSRLAVLKTANGLRLVSSTGSAYAR
jgi:hypothetical protein